MHAPMHAPIHTSLHTPLHTLHILFKVTQGRISATYEGDEAKSNTYKLFGNGGKIYEIHL